MIIFLFLIELSKLFASCARLDTARFKRLEISSPYLDALINGPIPSFKEFLLNKRYDLESSPNQDQVLDGAFQDFVKRPFMKDNGANILKLNIIDKFPLLKGFVLDPDQPLTIALDKFTLSSVKTKVDKYLCNCRASDRFKIFISLIVEKLRLHFSPTNERIKTDLDHIECSSKELLESVIESCFNPDSSLSRFINCTAEALFSKAVKVINNQDSSFDMLQFGDTIQWVKVAAILLQPRPCLLDLSNDRIWDQEFVYSLSQFCSSLLLLNNHVVPKLQYHWRELPHELAYSQPYRIHETRAYHINCDMSDAEMIQGGPHNHVYKIEDDATGDYFIYKKFSSITEFNQELRALQKIDSCYFAKYIADSFDLSSMKHGIVLEYIDGMNSKDYALNASILELKKMSAQLFLALEHLHSIGIVHADLKPENVLIDRSGTVKVVDLGFSFSPPTERRQMGTPSTMAPELIFMVTGEVHEAIDWWAYGSTVAIWFGTCVHFRSAATGNQFIPMYWHWSNARYVPGVVPAHFPMDLRNFLAIFFQPDPEDRRINTPRQLQRIRNDPFFNGVDWSQFEDGLLYRLNYS